MRYRRLCNRGSPHGKSARNVCECQYDNITMYPLHLVMRVCTRAVKGCQFAKRCEKVLHVSRSNMSCLHRDKEGSIHLRQKIGLASDLK